MTNKKEVLTIILLVLMLAAGTVISVARVYGIIISANKTGKIRAIDFQFYWDLSCTNVTSGLNWGDIDPNATRNLTVYIKNTGRISERLSMSTSNWNPITAQRYVMLTWDCENKILPPASKLNATFTLTILPNVTNLVNFNFDITITGIQNKS